MDDLKEGYGVISSNGGSRYEGTWHKGLQEGCGIEIYRDGSKEPSFIVQSRDRSYDGILLKNSLAKKSFVSI